MGNGIQVYDGDGVQPDKVFDQNERIDASKLPSMPGVTLYARTLDQEQGGNALGILVWDVMLTEMRNDTEVWLQDCPQRLRLGYVKVMPIFREFSDMTWNNVILERVSGSKGAIHFKLYEDVQTL